jgi:predicted phosphate transport protein (TIGR00153 family)
MALLFKRAKMLEKQIDEFLDAISQGAIVFKRGIKNYLEAEYSKFEEKLQTIDALEKKADDLRRRVENQLYSHSLIPEHRGDVLGILEHMDDVVDAAKETLNIFSIEKPEIFPEFHKDFIELSEIAANAAESVVLATRAFFTDVGAVKNHLHKVYFYEKESDKISIRLKKKIFDADSDLGIKIHQRYFAANVDSLSDIAESAADRLAIYTIKRTV